MIAETRVRRVVLIGNPNSGKTTLFNALTGLRQHVGNYPGVTVERKSGRLDAGAEIVDLPGAYSLAARSPDERLVIEALIGRNGDGPPDAILFIADASQLRRSLYLLSQVLEVERPVVVALNMVDAAAREGSVVDAQALSDRLGVPVVPIVASRGEGIPALRKALEATLSGSVPAPPSFVWPPALAQEIQSLSPGASGLSQLLAGRAIVDPIEGDGEFAERARASHARLRTNGTLPAALETRARYAAIDAVLPSVITTEPRPATTAQRLDRVLLHPIAGSLIFAAAMILVFMSIFVGAAPLMDLVDQGVSALAGVVEGWFSATPLAGGLLQSLIVDGVIGGVGAVLVFLPQIAILFFFLGLLEDCGYLARSAHLMDRVFRFCGMSGHSVVPLLSSFACAVPGIMATRTIPDRRDRFVTMIVAPLMSCSARIPVYALLISAFVPGTLVLGFLPLRGLTFVAMYLLGLAVAVPVAMLVRRTALRGAGPGFVMDLPRYQVPALRNVGLRVLERSRAFVTQAGTIILAISVIVWALGTFPRSAELRADFDAQRAEATARHSGDALAARISEIDGAEAGALLRQSALGRMGAVIEPVLAPLGWDWRIGVAVLASFPAREVVVSTLGILFDLGDAGDDEGAALAERLQEARTPSGAAIFTLPIALSILVFFALCCQCGATLATIRRETSSWRWPSFVFVYMTTLAYVGAWITSVIGRSWF